MSLQEQSAAYRKGAEQQLGAKVGVLDRDIERVMGSGLARHAAQAGQPAPEFTLPDAHGRQVSLVALLAKGPVVLSFYRGEWCPFCNLELKSYQDVMPHIEAAGANFLAISPEKPEFGQLLLDKQKLTFPVLSDAGNVVARAYGLVFEVGPEVQDLMVNTFGMDLSTRNGDDTWELPVPGTFVIDSQQTIRFAHVDPNYMTGRAEPQAILEVLRTMKSSEPPRKVA